MNSLLIEILFIGLMNQQTVLNNVLNNYAKAVEVGAYDSKLAGLGSKCDSVRQYWEDRYTRYVLSPPMRRLLERKRAEDHGLRIMDLGCGAGEGWNILTTLPRTSPTLDAQFSSLMNESDIEFYKGVDISPAMIGKAESIHAHHDQTQFAVADLDEGLPVESGEAPYDLYFSSYGSLSHLSDDSLGQLVENICQHMGDRAIFVADLLGRYSYEWPCYWGEIEGNGSDMQTYSMSYLYPPEKRNTADVERFPIRYWGGEELDRFLRMSAEKMNAKVGEFHLCDRSILVGRHTDTAEFNPQASPLRSAINSLHAIDVRTDLTQLIFDYQPHPHHPHINRFFQNLQSAWNALVYGCMESLDMWRKPEKLLSEPPIEHPPIVLDSIRILRRLINQAPNLHFDDPRANLIEPQLAYLLRNLEWNFQQGLGASHGLLAIYEFRR